MCLITSFHREDTNPSDFSSSSSSPGEMLESRNVPTLEKETSTERWDFWRNLSWIWDKQQDKQQRCGAGRELEWVISFNRHVDLSMSAPLPITVRGHGDRKQTNWYVFMQINQRADVLHDWLEYFPEVLLSTHCNIMEEWDKEMFVHCDLSKSHSVPLSSEAGLKMSPWKQSGE